MAKTRKLSSKGKPTGKEYKGINDLIFRELIKRGYALEGNTRIWDIADSKLWYLTPEQAQAFLDLEKSEEYQKDVIQKEIDLIKENLKYLLGDLEDKPLNIIDIGCGDGKKALIFLDHLKDTSKMRYCPIDISSYMVSKAIAKISKKDVKEIVKFQWNISDFENLENVATLLRYEIYQDNLFLLLGNTLGNFEINELLYEIRSSMKDNDLLLIGNGLDTRNPEEILKSYQVPQQDNFLIMMVEQLGLKRDEVKYEVRFNNSRVEAFYTVLKDVKIKFQKKELHFFAGDHITVAYSYKYDEDDFMSFLKMYFSSVQMFVSGDRSYALALCKK